MRPAMSELPPRTSHGRLASALTRGALRVPGRDRTCDAPVRSWVLYPLSYGHERDGTGDLVRAVLFLVRLRPFTGPTIHGTSSCGRLLPS